MYTETYTNLLRHMNTQTEVYHIAEATNTRTKQTKQTDNTMLADRSVLHFPQRRTEVHIGFCSQTYLPLVIIILVSQKHQMPADSTHKPRPILTKYQHHRGFSVYDE